jgi:hypothetical protein
MATAGPESSLISEQFAVSAIWCGRFCGRFPDEAAARTGSHTDLTYNSNMPEQLTRDRIIEALHEMPPDATIDDAIERLVFLGKIEAGLNELDAGEGIPHDEAKHRLGL